MIRRTNENRGAPRLRPTSLAKRLAVNLPIAGLVVVLILLNLGVVQTLRVSSINMVPTLALDDHVVVRAYGHDPARGDVVVYRSPFDYEHLQLGRIVAVGGDNVEMDEDGLRLDGHAVAAVPGSRGAASGAEACPAPPCEASATREPAYWRAEQDLLAAETVGEHRFFTRRAGGLSGLMFPRTTVPAEHVFVLSDNRVDERDSRIYGAIPRSAIVGVLSFVYYAFDETGVRWDRMSRPVS